MRRLIVHTPATGLNFLGVGGVHVINTHRQLGEVLRRQLGDAHACLLAEPRRTGTTGPIDWYTDLPGELRKLTALPPDAGAKARARLEQLRADIAAFAAAADNAQLGQRLRCAITFPSEEFVYVAVAEVVVVCWATTTELPSRVNPEMVKAPSAAAPAAAMPPQQSMPQTPVPVPVPVAAAPIVDAELARRREEQKAQQGEVTITLMWDGPTDLDLHVLCPGGEVIYHGRREAGGGKLDVDMNYMGNHSDRPIENIFWPAGAARPGRYGIVVKNATSGSGAVPFRVSLRVHGAERQFTGTASSTSEARVAEYEIA